MSRITKTHDKLFIRTSPFLITNIIIKQTVYVWYVVTMNENQNKWSEVANLVLNPRSNDVKLDTYSSLILDILYDEKDRSFNLNEISDGIQRKFALTNISPLILDDTLKYLKSEQIIENKNGNYTIT